MSLEIVSFDFGGTLAYEPKEDYIVYHDVLIKLGFEVDTGDVQLALKEAKEWWRQEKKQRKIWTEASSVKYADKMLSYLKIDGTTNLAERVARLWPEVSEFRAYDDVESTLQKLRADGYRLIIISNVASLRNLSIYLLKSHLMAYFDLLVASGSIGIEKPDKGIFLSASNELRVDPDKIMHVGDDYEADYLGAIASRFKAVLIDRNNMNANINAIRIQSLSELSRLIGKKGDKPRWCLQ